MSKTPVAILFALVLAGAILGCTPEVPASPTYNKDTQAIFVAHCVRCHGANNTLNGLDGMTAPRWCYFQRYGDEGDCSMLDNPDCKLGAGSMFCSSQVPGFISLPGTAGGMPPPPAEPLNGWEIEVLNKWVLANVPQ